MNPNPNVQSNARFGGGIQFRIGSPLLFIATRPFTLGSTGVQVRAQTEISFDGTTAQVDGQEFKLPFLRGAIKAGWMVLAEDFDETDPSYQKRVSANIQVRPNIGGNPLNPVQSTRIVTTESDEREVGSTRQHAQRTAANNKGFVRGQTPINVAQPGSTVRTQRGMMVVEPQDGVELDRTFATPAGERSKERVDLSSERAAQAMHVAKNAQIVAGKGITEDEMLERMNPDDREVYLSQKEALRAQYVQDVAPTQALPRPASRQVVARVQSKKNGQHEGMSFKNTVGGGTQIGDETDGEVVGTVHGNKDTVETFEEDGIKFTTTNAPRSKRKVAEAKSVPLPLLASSEPPPPVPANLDTRRQIAKMVCASFPENYDFTLSEKKKIARLQADYEDNFDVLRAVFAAESDSMKCLLLQEFSQAFAQ